MLPATPRVIARFVAEARAASDLLTTIATVMPESPGGPLVLRATLVHLGRDDFAAFRALAAPIADTLGPMRYRDVLTPGGGDHHVWAHRTMFLDALDVDAADDVLAHLRRSRSPLSLVQVRVLGGAMARVPGDSLMDTRSTATPLPEVDRPTGRGPVFTNPATGERAVLLADPATRPDRALVAHLHVAVGGRVAAPHSHPFATERFHVMTGRVAFLIGGRERVLVPGEQAEVPPGTVHDWWQIGETAAEVIVDMAPGDRFTDMLTTIFGLVRDGQVDRRGLPHLLQLAVTARHYRDAMVFTSPPPWLQTVLFGILAPLGRLLGRRPAYPRYRNSEEFAELDPRALALLDERGRLRWNSD